jgi:hypothetical protein
VNANMSLITRNFRGAKIIIQQQNNNDADIEDFLQAPHQLSYPIKAFSPKEVLQEIKLLNPRKAPGHDLIVGDKLKNLPRKT